MSERTAKQEALSFKKAKRADLQKQIDAAKEAQAAKMKASKDHLLGQIKVNGEKYLTVNGYMDARYILEQAYLGDYAEEAPIALRDNARNLAEMASDLLSTLYDKVEAADVKDYPTLLDEHYDHRFIYSGFGEFETAEQLMRISIIQNIGPALDDAYSFWEGTEAELAKLQAELKAV